MKTACLLLGLVAFVAACPDEWVNPCVIAGRGGELNARNRQWCGTSGAGYLGRLGYEVSGSYINNGFRLRYGGRTRNINFYTNRDYVYLQECSNACVNHPTCTSFAFESREHGRNQSYRWDDHAAGDLGHRFNGKTSTILRGRCYLYKYCNVNTLRGQSNRKQWWLGVRSMGAYDGTSSHCTNKIRLSHACNNDNTCIKDCPSGEFFTQVNGKNACKSCPSGTWKSGRNAAQSCNPHEKCDKGEYLHSAGDATRDNDCRTHSPVCGNDSYQTQAPTSTQDRKCRLCKICPAGTEIEKGCLKNDPWVGITYSTSSSGKSEGAISVTQVHDITHRTVVLHGPNKEKIGCGTISHDKKLNLDVATISKIPGYNGSLNPTGTFRFLQKHSTLKASYVLSGLPANAMGMIHVHEGKSCHHVGSHFYNNEKVAHSHRRLLEAGHPSLTANAVQKNWDGNTICTPCVATQTFSTKASTAVCYPVTDCKIGYHVTRAGTATADQVCSRCTNKIPANSEYYENEKCLWRCKSGFSTVNNGTECSKAGAKIVFKNKSVQGQLQSYENNVVSFNNFKCVEGLKVCGMSATLKQLEARVAALEAKI